MFLIPQSTIGKKIIVALTGVVMLGFVIGHLAGNLQIFMGPAQINDYSMMLKKTLPLLWGTRLVLIVSVVLHIICTVQLNAHNRASRPIGYVQHEMVQASVPSRFMIWSGVFLAGYIIYHILHLTLGKVGRPFSHTDVYANMIDGFSVPYISILYILAMISLGLHLHHGIYSVFQTLGLNHPKYNAGRKILAVGTAIVVALGYISIPAAVMLGMLGR